MKGRYPELEEMFKNREIFGKKYLGIILAVWTIMNLVVCGVAGADSLFKSVSFTIDDAWALAGIQVTISLLSITGFEIISESFMERVVGVSYKQILFHHSIFKVNTLDCIVILAISAVTSIGGICLACMTSLVRFIRMGKMLVLLTTVVSVIFAIWLFYFVVIVKYKTSVIYYKIYKVIESGNNTIIKKVDKFIEKMEEEKKSNGEKVEVTSQEYMYRDEIDAITMLREKQKAEITTAKNKRGTES